MLSFSWTQNGSDTFLLYVGSVLILTAGTLSVFMRKQARASRLLKASKKLQTKKVKADKKKN